MSRKRKKQKNNSFLLMIIILIIIGGYIYYSKYYHISNIKLKNTNIEINSEVTISDIIEDIKNGKLLNGNEVIDTSKLGNKKIILNIDNNTSKTYEIDIKIVDTISPIIEGKKEITIYAGNEIDLLKDVNVSDNSKEKITAKVVGEYDVNTDGKYELKYLASDSSNNTSEYDFILNVISDEKNKTFKTSKGYLGKVIDGVTYIDGILIANKTYSLPSSYGNGLTNETKEAFNKMQADAKAAGLSLWLSSGYRSYYDQKYIYNNYVARDGQVAADTYSARAGHSEHQTGLAFDLNTISDSFAYTNEGKWVSANCYKYGLILRYPKGKENITGYKYESWHLRYVGVSLAAKLYNDGDWITLEEYYGIDSKYQ